MCAGADKANHADAGRMGLSRSVCVLVAVNVLVGEAEAPVRMAIDRWPARRRQAVINSDLDEGCRRPRWRGVGSERR